MKSEKDNAQRWLAAENFKLGLYQHHKGGLYIVFATSVNEATLEKMVHYYSIKKKTRWTRTMEVFLEPIEKDEHAVNRFMFHRALPLADLIDAAGLSS